uniref:Uncharacterized LOC111535748 n=1 Tax=Piliocolobus tephrosceles TaxID=591936 RepID=A0A8C9GRR1_9PRIM
MEKLRKWCFGTLGDPRRRGQVGNMAAPTSRFPMGYTMLEECPFRIEDEDTSKLTEQAVCSKLRWSCPAGGGEQGWGRFSGRANWRRGLWICSLRIWVIPFRDTEGPLGKNQGRLRLSPGRYHRMRSGEMSGWLQAFPRTYHKGRRRRNQGCASPPRICHEVGKGENSECWAPLLLCLWGLDAGFECSSNLPYLPLHLPQLKRDYVAILIIFNVSLVQCNMSIKIFRKLYYFYFLMK